MDRYRFLEKVGDGTYGSVFKAANKKNGELVAVKRLKTQHQTWEASINLREIESLRSISTHKNVVDIKELIREDDSKLYFVFEYMPDGHLHQLTKNILLEKARRLGNKSNCMTQNSIRGLSAESIDNTTQKLSYYHESNWTSDRMLFIIKQVLSGLEHMHSHGYVHRDIKPENLLLRGDHCKIADFGLSRQICPVSPAGEDCEFKSTSTARTKLTEYISTRWYRAPEVLLRSPNYGPPIDIFATGCVLVELLTLRPLLPGSSEIDQIQKTFNLLGFPSENHWRDGVRLLQNTKIYVTQNDCTVHVMMNDALNNNANNGASLNWMKTRSLLKTIMPAVGVKTIAFIQQLLSLDPKTRATAHDCLQHECFKGDETNHRQNQNVLNAHKKSDPQATQRSPLQRLTPALEIENNNKFKNKSSDELINSFATIYKSNTSENDFPVVHNVEKLYPNPAPTSTTRLSRKRKYIQQLAIQPPQLQQHHHIAPFQQGLHIVPPTSIVNDTTLPIQYPAYLGIGATAFVPENNTFNAPSIASNNNDFSALPNVSGFGHSKFRSSSYTRR